MNTKYKQVKKARTGMAAMAARAICKETVSFGLVNIVPIQVSIVRQEEANHPDTREASRGEWLQ